MNSVQLDPLLVILNLTQKTSYWKIKLSFSLQVSANDVDALYEVYKKDFLMFGYSSQVYKVLLLMLGQIPHKKVPPT